MREIKFRVWSDKSKSWLKDENVLSFYISNDGELEIDCSDWSKSKLTIQQYTGLKDKNGVEIYEGDLLLSAFWRDKENPVEVSWGDENSGWNVNYRNGQKGPLLKIHQQSYEVIGNIFEGVDKWLINQKKNQTDILTFPI